MTLQNSVKKQRRAKEEDIATIFRYRGCGFSMEQISEITNLSPQTVSYQLSKLKKLVDDGSISDVVLYEARHYPASRVLDLEQELAKIIEDHHYEIEKYQNRIEELEYNFRYQTGPDDADNQDDHFYDYGDELLNFLYLSIPKEFLENGGAIIDASQVLFHHKEKSTDKTGSSRKNTTEESYDFDVVPNQRGLSSMINSLENQGWPVIAIMTFSEFEYATSGKMPLISNHEMDSLKNLLSARKLLLFTDDMQLNQLFQDLIGENHKIRIVTNEPTLVEKNPDRVVTYDWHGPVCRFESLPTGGLDGLRDAEIRSSVSELYPTLTEGLAAIDHANLARGNVMSLLSQGELVSLSAIHRHLATVFLGVDPHEEKGWVPRLKDRLSLEGKNFSTQLSNLMGDMIEFSDGNKLVRKRLGGMKDE